MISVSSNFVFSQNDTMKINHNLLLETYYKLTLGKNTRMFYKTNKGENGSYQQGRVSSSNYEPSERRVTFRINP